MEEEGIVFCVVAVEANERFSFVSMCLGIYVVSAVLDLWLGKLVHLKR